MLPVITLLSLAISGSPPRWGVQGHHLVCEIAWQRLSPKARVLVQHLRDQDPDARDSFANDCLWADAVRSTTHKFTYYYHFINIPPNTTGMDRDRDCGVSDRRCAPWAIRHYARVLQDSTAPPLQRVEALKFVAHFVGDLHQPLHAGRAADRGGNDVPVWFFGERVIGGDTLNLHRIWDTYILARANRSAPQGAVQLNADITVAEATEWSSASLSTWVAESYRISEGLVYALPPGNRIGQQYYNRALSASKMQLQRAGVRLAALLNAIADGTLTPALLEF